MVQAAPQAAFGVLILGTIYTALPAVLIAFVITAPLGCAIGISMLKLFEPGPWQGAANGAITAAAIVVVLVLLTEGALTEVPDPGTIIFVLALIGIGAGSGWLAQRKCINWPEADA
ncbi:hypothetical protein [Erythrobacter crassostreae]|uniref:Uncharacterized protein n=1 Tax=Erythrobacter crassostreae TaxID=2828328 RepID=A0A9X1JLZ2_9SPHN|nr:hypothetical protein [Erythrobacter crassostrea]MBV7258834.1 hypothetical protein [Erythrobacter crassostrea]